SNVLVTEHDGTPVVKVIDFGVAKALADNLTEKTMFTGVFQMIGTPLYMSPEQASLSNLDVDTRSDVYSLGVMLYELLSGTLPIDRESAKELSMQELQHQICESVPPTPSKRLSTLGNQGDTISESRRSRSRSLKPSAARELDWVAMKSIEKDRTRRYQSPRELAEDIDRFLRREAVTACPPSRLYTLRVAYRRHRNVFLFSTALGVLLLASGIGIGWFAWLSVKAERDMRVALQRVETKAEETQAIYDFFIEDMLRAVAPSETPNAAELTVREMLDRAAKNIAGEFSEKPHLEASVRTLLSSVYLRLEDYSSALEHAEIAYRLNRRLFGESHPQTLMSMNNIGSSSMSLGNSERGMEIIRSGLERIAEQRVPNSNLKTGMLEALGLLQLRKGMLTEAKQTLEEALECGRQESDRNAPLLISIQMNLSTIEQRLGNLEESRSILEEALTDALLSLGEGHTTTMLIRENMAMVLFNPEEIEEHEAMLRPAVEQSIERFGESHPTTVRRMNFLYTGIGNQGRFEEAIEGLRRVLVLAEESVGLEPLVEPRAKWALSTFLSNLDRFEEALELQRDLLAVSKKAGEVRSRMKGVIEETYYATLSNYVRFLCLRCEPPQPDPAIPLAEEMMAFRGDARAWNALAIARFRKGEFEEALKAFEEADRLDEALAKPYRFLFAESAARVQAKDRAAALYAEGEQFLEDADATEEWWLESKASAAAAIE
ncbi:MAG: tetratricopeptide repeat protein, partial [Planctomycetota bacterium]